MKKGFTIVELLGVVVIMTVLLLIAVPTYNNVRENMNESVYESKIKDVASKGEVFAEETGSVVFDIKRLIKEGKLEADSELGNYIDPRTNRDMSCDIINVRYENGSYYANVTESDTCYSEEELENIYGMIELYIVDDEGSEIPKIEGTDWLPGERVNVAYRIKDEYREYESKIEEITWIGDDIKTCTKTNLEECRKTQVSNVNTKNITVKIRIKVAIESDVYVVSSANKNVLLDNELPQLVAGSLNYSNEVESDDGRRVEFLLTDKNGSGIKEYALVKNKSCEGEEYESKKKSASNGRQVEYLFNGTYYICVTDKVGNHTDENDFNDDSHKITIEGIDQEELVLSEITNSSNGNWVNGKVTLSWTINKPENKIYAVQYSFDRVTWTRLSDFYKYETEEEQNRPIYIRAIDKAGNVSNIRETMIKIDKTGPSVSFGIGSSTAGSNGWYKALSVKATLTDSASGVGTSAKYCVTTASTCTPTTSMSVSSNAISVPFGSSTNAQKLCVESSDKLGNSSGVKCSSTYKVDVTDPTQSFGVASSTAGSNGWYKALSIKVTPSDTPSGVASSKYCVTTGGSCTPTTNGSATAYNVTLGSNANAQKVCANVTDKAGRTGATTCSSAYKVDTTNPGISWSVAASTAGQDGWYRVMKLKASLSDAHSGVSSVKYCVTTGSTCTPGITGSISSNSTTITLGSNASAQKVCAQVTDKSGRTSSVICSGAYKNDVTKPTAAINATTNMGNITISAAGSTDAHSGIKTYQYSKNNSSWASSTANTYTFTGYGNGTYTVYLRVVDKAGNISDVKQITKTVVLEDPDNYEWSKTIACDTTKFNNAINTGKFKEYIEHQQFRNAMYDCPSSAGEIWGNREAEEALRRSSRFELITTRGRSGRYTYKDTSSYDPKPEMDYDAYAWKFMNTAYNGKALILSASCPTDPKSSVFNTTAWYCDDYYDSWYCYQDSTTYETLEGWCDYETSSGSSWGDGTAKICVGEPKEGGEFYCDAQVYIEDGAFYIPLNDVQYKRNRSGYGTEFFKYVPSVGGIYVSYTNICKEKSNGDSVCEETTQYRAGSSTNDVIIQIFKI